MAGDKSIELLSLPLTIAAALKSRQIPRQNRDAGAKEITKIALCSRFVLTAAKLLDSRCVRPLIRSRLIRPLVGCME